MMGCSTNSESIVTPALFETKSGAEAAAINFNCTGAHQMGDKWMPCKSHTIHDKRENHYTHEGNDHHQGHF